MARGRLVRLLAGVLIVAGCTSAAPTDTSFETGPVEAGPEPGRSATAAPVATITPVAVAAPTTTASDATPRPTPPPATADDVEPPIERSLPQPPDERRLLVDEPAATPGSWYRTDRLDAPGSDAVRGVLTFRGSPSRSYLGSGPVPTDPAVVWTYPEQPMCSLSTDDEGTRQWCGTGWTGQPAVWERNGELWLAFGAFDRRVHFLDALTGRVRLVPFETGDIIKGSVTVDPDGHPLLYVGSRDNQLRALAFDGDAVRELWSLDANAVSPTLWNDDWDGAPVVIDDHLFVGGENSNFHALRLNRSYRPSGAVAVRPELLAVVPGWDRQLLDDVGDNVSIESSVTVVGDTAWFANSGGLVQAWDLAPLRAGGQPERTLRFWIGDDTDATVVVDDDGFAYAAAEYERDTGRSRELGQIVKLDPRRPEDPVVWSVEAQSGLGSGVWATPAIWQDLLIVAVSDGRLLGLDRATGATEWVIELAGPMWSSPVVVDDVLIQAACDGRIHAFDLAPGTDPERRWTVQLDGCIESTPTVWGGSIWVGTRAGFMHRLADDERRDG